MRIFAAENQINNNMFKREVLRQLESWKADSSRKPLVLRGPRQVGKTTVVNEFGKLFDNYLYYNLEREADRKVLEMPIPLHGLMEILFVRKGSIRKAGTTLLFIDEIQNSPKVISLLRYFYEELPEIYVIAAGSLLENLVDVQTSFPVGRVEYMAMHPCSFKEFLGALDREDLIFFINHPEMACACHQELMALFNQYAIVGGMPEIVQHYANHRDVLAMDKKYEALLQSYRDDVEKYVRGKKLADVVRFILSYGWANAGQTVTLGRFSGSDYNAREVGEAFRLLNKAMILELVYPTTSPNVPIMPEIKRMPKLIWFDTGLVNYAAGVRKEVIGSMDIMDAWRGHIAEHVVAQELLCLNDKVAQERSFWMKGSGGGSAEVDFVWQVDSVLVPIEVKSGINAHLRSLHSFIELSVSDIAVRVWSGEYGINELVTPYKGKRFKLINLPFYMLGNLEQIVRDVKRS